VRIPSWMVFLVPIVPAGLLIYSVGSDLRTFEGKAPYVEVSGRVANLDCQNHGQYQVSFNVRGRELNVGAGNLYLRKACTSLRVGEIVPVWYSESDPQFASFVPPDQALPRIKNELLLTVLIPYPLWVIFLFIVSRYENKNFFARKAKTA
jgi:hypothetical protein